jgi:choline dehydrogenase
LPDDTTSSPNAPDIELFVSPVAYQEHGLRVLDKGFAIHGVLLRCAACASSDPIPVIDVEDRPTSLGTITLKSSNPFDKPVINPKWVSSDFGCF